MKKKVSEPIVIQYPFDEYHMPYRCNKCDRLLRYSALHGRVYVVSELQTSEILSNRPHLCVKDRSKGAKK